MCNKILYRLILTLSYLLLNIVLYAQDLSKIYGKIQIVNNFPDYKVKVVDNFADIEIQVVDNFPDKAGLWQFVQNFPDYKIQYVDSNPDFTVKFVKHFASLTNEGKSKTKNYRQKNIFGKIKIVSSGEDYKVKKTNSSFADLSIKLVDSRPKSGEWQYVTSEEDYKIKFVTSGEDFSVKITE